MIAAFVMPETNRTKIVEAARAVRADCPIVTISTGSPEIAAATALRQARARGANATLAKPFTGEALARAIESANGSWAVRRRLGVLCRTPPLRTRPLWAFPAALWQT